MNGFERFKLVIGTLLMVSCLVSEYVLHSEEIAIMVLALSCYALVGYDVVAEMLHNFAEGRFFDEETLMSVATIGAIAIGAYTEAAAVMFLFKIGETLEYLAVYRSKRSVRELMDLQPDTANLLEGDRERIVQSSELRVDDMVMVRSGERVPTDGIVVEGRSSLDMKDLTGEPTPRDVREGDGVLSGSVNLTGPFKVRVFKVASSSTAARILALIDESESRKSRSEKFITAFSRIYTPFVILCAIAVAVIPPVLMSMDWYTWIYRSMVILVIACPCALVISVPLAFFCGIGRASSEGILIKGSGSIEALSKTGTVVMDKTGTLTKGTFAISKAEPVHMEEEELLSLVAGLESYSNHPISKPFRGIARKSVDITSIEESIGLGIEGTVDGRRVIAGNSRLMDERSIRFSEVEETGVTIHVSVDGEYEGYILLEDERKEDAKESISLLRRNGVESVVMLTGDRQAAGRRVADELGMDGVFSELLPSDKVEKVERLMSEMTKGRTLVFVGDGMNDAPVLARSDVGIAMGGLGSDAAIESADVVIMSDEPIKVPEAIGLSKKVMRTVWANVITAIGVKILFMCLAMAGLISMWAGVFADVGMLLILVANSVMILGRRSLRQLFVRNDDDPEPEGCLCECCHGA